MPNYRLNSFLVLFAVVGLGVAATHLAHDSRPENAGTTFNAHDFALFRTHYEVLKFQAAVSRAAYLHRMIEVVERPNLTGGMVENLVEFVRNIHETDESPEVRSEALFVLNEMNRRLTRNLAAAERNGR